ncbi:putative membrane or secreted protein [Rhodopirellula maiorica SM1]|uniref:Putative membrane or secreted protein n=1 Tax=Rhodopirellula maiorica SM1 TaxID=1265738 RepID=M5S144_9BACT|nr:hypothetical protein [Rhodopirellula maiorica]EMI21367.1 putative membrane or secreted protein [Rhodopirellula maiorica SM1]
MLLLLSRDRVVLAVLMILGSLLTANVGLTQTAEMRRAMKQQQEFQKRLQQQRKAAAENSPTLPTDPQLMELHKEFISRAEKLAADYEKKNQTAEARQVYEAIVRLVPKYQPAEEGLSRMIAAQSVQDRKLTEVFANRGWQDSGVTLVQGMPVHMEVKGGWKVVLETDAKGVVIPNEIKPKSSDIKLGTLIGVIATSPSELDTEKPFVVVRQLDFINKKTGRLFLKMFDIDPSDNEGKIHVLIQSTFP